MAKKITALFFILWIAAVTTLCRGWGEETFQDAMDKAKFGASEAKKSASEAMQDAKEKTGSWADLASNKFSEEFGFDEKNVKDGSRRLMSDANDTVNAAAAEKARCHKACEMNHNDEQRSGNDNENNDEGYAYYTADRPGGVYDYTSRWGYDPMKPYSRRAADEARRNSQDTILDRVFEAIHMLEIIAKNERDIANRAEDDPDKTKKVIDRKVNIIKMATEGGFGDDKLKLLFGEDGPELVQKYKEAKSNLQETYRTAKETKTEMAKERFEEAKKKASQVARELGRRIGADF